MNRRKTFSLASLLMFTALIAIGLFLWNEFSDSARYKRNGDGQTLLRLLGSRVNLDDSTDSVRRVLGPGTPDDGTYASRIRNWERQAAAVFSPPRTVLPSGLNHKDQLVFYYADPGDPYLFQLRDGRLIYYAKMPLIGGPGHALPSAMRNRQP